MDNWRMVLGNLEQLVQKGKGGRNRIIEEK